MASVRIPLTERQNQLLQFLRRKIQVDGFPPTMHEICAELSLKSTNGVSQMLQALEKKGYIKPRTKGASRGIQLLGQQPVQQAQAAVKNVVIIGEGTASEPLTAFLNPRGQLAVDTSYFAGEGQIFAAEVSDDGMSAEHILAGDLVICVKKDKSKVGSLVVAIYQESTLVRRLAGAGELHPASKGFQKVTFAVGDDSVAILGNVIGVVRKIR